MRIPRITGVAIVALGFASPALAIPDSGAGAPPVMMPGDVRPLMVQPLPEDDAPLPPRDRFDPPEGPEQGRYVVPHYGYQLPRDWMGPTHFISDWRSYGLTRPAAGYGWSRYYDDAVLTDRWGRVYDWRRDVRRDGRDGRYDRRTDRRGGSGVGGAIAGAVVGGVAGNVIAGRGNRLPGTIIGGGLGAIAGAAIDRGGQRRGDDGYRDGDYDRGPGDYDRGDYDRGDYDRGGDRDGRGYRRDDRYGGGGWSSGPHWFGGSQGGVYSYGYGGGGDTVVTTVVIQPSTPVVQTVTSTSYEYISVPVKRRIVRRHHRPRKPVCVC